MPDSFGVSRNAANQFAAIWKYVVAYVDQCSVRMPCQRKDSFQEHQQAVSAQFESLKHLSNSMDMGPLPKDLVRRGRFKLVACGWGLHAAPLHSHKHSSLLRATSHADAFTTAVETDESQSASSAALVLLKQKLLSEVAGTNRGALATLGRHRMIEDMVLEIENSGPSTSGAESNSGLDGTWELVYTTAQAFRSSPFFWAFQEGLVRDTDLSAAVFKFTDSIPGAEVGRCVQKIDLATGSLISEVELSVFPGLRGSVITTSTITGNYGDVINVSVQSTCVAGSNILPFLDQVEVPVREIFERIRGEGATGVAVRSSFVDRDLRISRTLFDGEIFVYRRVAG